MPRSSEVHSQKSAIVEFGQRLNRKIHSVGYRRELFCYLLVEELSLLLNVPAIYVRSVGRARTVYQGFTGWKISRSKGDIDADTNIRQRELESLHREFTNVTPIELATGVSQKSLPDGMVFSELENGRLTAIDRNIDLQIKIDELELYIRLWYTDSVDEERRIVLSSLLDGDLSWHFLLGELEDVRKTEAESPFAEQREHKDEFDISSGSDDTNKSWFSIRKSEFLKECEGLDANELVQEYNNRFLPLVKVSNRIRLACRHLIAPDVAQNITDYAILYRAAGEDRISFLLSNNQTAKFLPHSLEDFSKILRWWYREVGPSGYVLKTGHSEFCPDPDTDPRWAAERSQEISGIRRVIRKLQAPDTGGEPTNDIDYESLYKNTFFMPLCIQRKTTKRNLLGDEVFGNDVRMLVECRLPKDAGQQYQVRRRLFDLAWEFMPAIEAAIAAQINTEAMIAANELRRQDLARWASLIHDLPKYVVQPTEVAVKNASREFGFLCGEQGNLSGKRVERIHEELNRAIAKTEHAHYLLLLASPGDTNSRKPIDLKHMSPVRLTEYLREEASRYVRSIVEYKYGEDTFHPIDDVDEVGRQRNYKDIIRVELDVAGDIPELEVPIYILTTMLYNHVDNSLEELIEHCGDQVFDDPELGLIHIVVAFERDLKCIVLNISDHGRGMPDGMRKDKQNILNKIIREGKFPEIESLKSDKSGNMGAGLFNNAIMLGHLNRDHHLSNHGSLTLLTRKDGESGLVVQLTVPVSMPTVAWSKRGKGYRRLTPGEVS